jgi:hypothetical protein
VIEPGLVDRLDGVLIGLLAQVDAANLGADVLGKGNDIEPCVDRMLRRKNDT